MRSDKPNFTRILTLLTLCALLIGLSLPARAQSSVTLLVHDITVQPIPGTAAYDVAVVFSLLDSAGNPIKDAALTDFTLTEDSGDPMQAVSLEEAEEPINVAIVLDTSGSMVGEKITAARNAASRFIDELQSSDKVAVLTFDNTVTHRIDFTTDHAAAKQHVELVDYTPGGGTCLYDAAYETVQMTAALPTGRRAVILLTDGVDEAGGQPCSFYTLEEVISLASQPEARVPLYTIGLGDDVDAISLDRMASATNGRYQASPGTTQLDALFGRLADELRSQFVLHYTSVVLPGSHNLVIQVNYNGAEDEVSREIEMPTMPYSISFTAPVEGATVGNSVTVMVSISGQGAPIAKVIFLAKGDIIGTVTSPPYEYEWTVANIEAGVPFLLEAVAQDTSNAELARSSVTVTYQGEPTPTPAAEAGGGTGIAGLSKQTTIIIASVLGVLVAAVVVVIVLSSKKRKDEKERDRRWKETVQGEGVSAPAVAEDRTMDSFTPSEGALGMLVVVESDDPSLKGQRYEINRSVTTLGRKSTNDIMFPKDGAVSRQHAVIEERGGQLYVSEVLAADETGKPKPPTYGTFVNDQQIEAPVALRNGDLIRLGKRACLRFESLGPTPSDTDSTMDQFSDSDKTVDG